MKVMLQKLIGVLCCEVPTLERLGRKVLQVRSDDHIRSESRASIHSSLISSDHLAR